jgi:hypothetical protein
LQLLDPLCLEVAVPSGALQPVHHKSQTAKLLPLPLLYPRSLLLPLLLLLLLLSP